MAMQSGAARESCKTRAQHGYERSVREFRDARAAWLFSGRVARRARSMALHMKTRAQHVALHLSLYLHLKSGVLHEGDAL